MTREDKELLLKDLSTRLMYGLICQVDDGAAGLNDGKLEEIDIPNERVRFADDGYWDAYIDDVKPYLRPMSSMTEEERLLFYQNTLQYNKETGYSEYTYESIDWLNKNHFDYRGLIPKGLAVEVTEKNNPYNK